jgi:hypothetical protein
MIPSKKSPVLEQLLEEMFGRTTAIEKNLCVVCKTDVGSFRDKLSEKEYAISGLCQKCQDSVFD